MRACVERTSRGSQQPAWVKPKHRVESRLVADSTDKRRRWIRRLSKFGLAAAGLMTLASFFSYYGHPVYVGDGWMIWFGYGGVAVHNHPLSFPPGLQISQAVVSSVDVFEGVRDWFGLPKMLVIGAWYFPLGMPVVVLVALSSFILWKTRRPFPEGHCRRCGYDLRGNESGRCSECGAGVETE